MNTNSSEAFNLSLEFRLAVSRSAGPSRAQQAARLSGSWACAKRTRRGSHLGRCFHFRITLWCGIDCADKVHPGKKFIYPQRTLETGWKETGSGKSKSGNGSLSKEEKESGRAVRWDPVKHIIIPMCETSISSNCIPKPILPWKKLSERAGKRLTSRAGMDLSQTGTGRAGYRL